MMHSHNLIMAIIILPLKINEHNEFYIADIKSLIQLVIPVYQHIVNLVTESSYYSSEKEAYSRAVLFI